MIDEKEIKSLIESQLECTALEIVVEGNHVKLTVESPAFAGLSPVKRQQLVYATLNDKILSGTIHAVHMKTSVPAVG